MNVKKTNSTNSWVDPDDAPELTARLFAKGKKMIGNHEVSDRTFREAVKVVRRGRPPVESPKKPVSIRLSPDVIEYFKSTGKGWQTRMNEVLREYVMSHR